jgi:hypothetical protein
MKREPLKISRWKYGNQTADSHIPTASATATLAQNKKQKEPSKARRPHFLQAHPSIGKDLPTLVQRKVSLKVRFDSNTR